ncbi:MAG: Cna B-type domain-containing protein [Clostridia bacterium]|nr:Cna B-type domain-containing protein [Clostridia bacterium]
MKQAGKRRDSDRRRRVLACLFAAVLLFSSFPSLSLSDSPADSPEMQNAASETVLICEIPESDPVTAETRTWKKAFQVHRHSDSCYNNEGKLICGIWEDAYYHTHNEWCYDEDGKLSCGLSEKRPHSHSDDCYTTEQILKCELKEEEGHRHSDACYTVTDTLICGQEEREGHTHGEECYQTREKLVCGLEEFAGHSHTDDCYTEHRELSCGLEEDPGHTHADSCWSETEVNTLTCGQEEREPVLDENGEVTDPGHKHTDACYTAETVRTLICEEKERPGHLHGDSCYTVTRTLTCGQEEREGHTHSEACRHAVKELVCTKAEDPGHHHTEACHQITRTLSCGLEEREGHHHSASCYESRSVLICDLPDSTHRHTEDCFSGGEATCGKLEVPVFVSSEENWATKTEIISEGHSHTEACYAVPGDEESTSSEELSGTADASGENEIPPAGNDDENPAVTGEDVPDAANARKGEADETGNKTNLTDEQFKNNTPASGKQPEVSNPPQSVEQPQGSNQPQTVEQPQGSNQPQTVEQPQESNPPQTGELPQGSTLPTVTDTPACFEGELTSEDGMISIQADPEALLPADVSLKVQLVNDPEQQALYEARIREMTGGDGEMTLVRLMDLSLVDGEEQKVQPERPVRVSVRMTDAIPEGAELRVLHFPDEPAAQAGAAPAAGKRLLKSRRMTAAVPSGPEEIPAKYSGQEITFDAGGFSVYAIVYVLDGEEHTILVNEDPEKGSFSCHISWLPEPPANAQTTVLLYRQTDGTDAKPESADRRIVLDGVPDSKGETSAWTAVFEELPMKTPEGQRIRYMVREKDISPEAYQAYLASVPMGPDDYMDTDGGTIYHKVPEAAETCVLFTIRNTDPEGNLLSGAEFLILKRTMVAGESGEERLDEPYNDGFHEDGVYAAGNEGKQLGLMHISLPEGTYVISQEKAPYACGSRSKRWVTIQVADGKISQIQDSEEASGTESPRPLTDKTLLFINSISLVHVVLKKADEADAASMLSGAVFKISAEKGDGSAPISLDGQDEFESDEKGVFFEGMLVNGVTYLLQEITAPETYVLPEKEFRMEVAPNRVTLTVPGKDSLDFTPEEEGKAVEVLVPNWHQPFYTVHHYLKGTKEKVAEDTVIYAPAGTAVRSVKPASEFLEEFTGYTPELNSMSPAGGIRILEKAKNEITAWYTLPLKITVRDRELTYNGQKQFGYGIEDEGAAEFSGLLARDRDADWTTKIYNRAEGTNVTAAKGYSGSLRWENEALIPRYYQYTLTPGRLVILPKKITASITGKAVTRTYNGIENAAIGYTVEVSDENYLKYNIRFSGERTVRRKDAGISYMGLRAEQFSNISRNYEVSFEITDGYIKVEPRAMKVITGSKTKTYDGEPLVFESARLIGAVAADGIKVRATGKITEVGKTENTCVIEWNGANPENYTVTEQLGTLQVKAAPTPKSTGKTSGSSYSFSRSRKKESVPVTLRIIYQVNGEEEAPPERIAEYMSGDSYYVVSPMIHGYRADREIVEGKITRDVTIRVTYSKVSYRLEIRYVKLDGSRAAASYSKKLEYGTEFSVPSPAVKGFVPALEQVGGTMGTGELLYTVLYLPENTDESGDSGSGRILSIDEYATPTGFGLSYQQLGVCLE